MCVCRRTEHLCVSVCVTWPCHPFDAHTAARLCSFQTYTAVAAGHPQRVGGGLVAAGVGRGGGECPPASCVTLTASDTCHLDPFSGRKMSAFSDATDERSGHDM